LSRGPFQTFGEERRTLGHRPTASYPAGQLPWAQQGEPGNGFDEGVLDNHLKSFSKGDLEGILSDYASEAVMFTPDGPLRGPGEMRPLFQALIAEFGKPGAVFTLKRQSVDGDYAYILWTAETADNVYEVATDTFVVRNGKITAQSFTGKITPKG
jgi:SnoaL-like domain